MQYVLFWGRLFSIRMMFLSFIHLVACIYVFLIAGSISLYEFTTVCLSILLMMDMGYLQFSVLWINHKHFYTSLFLWNMFSYLISKYLRVELLGWGYVWLYEKQPGPFSKVVLTFCTPANNVWNFEIALHPWQHLMLSVSNFIHFSGYVMVSLGGFNLHFPSD